MEGIEHDLLGDFAVPADAYYGVQTARALENFQSTYHPTGGTVTSATHDSDEQLLDARDRSRGDQILEHVVFRPFHVELDEVDVIRDETREAQLFHRGLCAADSLRASAHAKRRGIVGAKSLARDRIAQIPEAALHLTDEGKPGGALASGVTWSVVLREQAANDVLEPFPARRVRRRVASRE